MYDTVNLRLTAGEYGGVSFLDETPQYLTDIAEHNYNGDLIVTGSLDGLKVTVNSWQIKVKDTSLCKWYLGDNLKTLGRGDVQMAFERMSDLIHLPMKYATVTRLDVACNFIMCHPIDVYLNHLGALAWSKRLLQPSGLYYHKANEVLCFYDKNREQRVKGEPLNELYQGRNVLRYEQRFTKRLATVLGVPVMNGETLYNEAFYIAVLKRWRDTYNDISKINDIQLNYTAMKGKQGLYRFGVLALVEQFGGEIALLSQIDEARKRGELTTKQAYDIREAVKNACQEREGLTVKNEAINELSKKVAEAVRFYR